MSGGVSQKTKLTCPTFGFFGVLSPLRSTNGVVFPYSPTVQIGHSASYGSYDTTHSVYQQQYYINTPNPTYSITGTFSSQTLEDAQYTAAALHFFKSCLKGEFGGNTYDTAGVPPAICKFSTYGAVHAKNIPVIVRSFSYTLTEDAEYVTVPMPVVGDVDIPSICLVTLDLVAQYPPNKVRDEFNLTRFKSGSALNRGFG
jgi:hypothetical protein